MSHAANRDDFGDISYTKMLRRTSLMWKVLATCVEVFPERYLLCEEVFPVCDQVHR